MNLWETIAACIGYLIVGFFVFVACAARWPAFYCEFVRTKEINPAWAIMIFGWPTIAPYWILKGCAYVLNVGSKKLAQVVGRAALFFIRRLNPELSSWAEDW